jgi:hypothetical protein
MYKQNLVERERETDVETVFTQIHCTASSQGEREGGGGSWLKAFAPPLIQDKEFFFFFEEEGRSKENQSGSIGQAFCKLCILRRGQF